jgi:hypothetical protein
MISSFTEKLINKQFEMIGVKFRHVDIPEDGIILVDKKKKNWYDYYKFENVEQYQEWKKFILEQLNGNEREANRIDFIYGMVYKYKREDDNLLPFTIPHYQLIKLL